MAAGAVAAAVAVAGAPGVGAVPFTAAGPGEGGAGKPGGSCGAAGTVAAGAGVGIERLHIKYRKRENDKLIQNGALRKDKSKKRKNASYPGARTGAGMAVAQNRVNYGK